jgi:hypothetical protein
MGRVTGAFYHSLPLFLHVYFCVSRYLSLSVTLNLCCLCLYLIFYLYLCPPCLVLYPVLIVLFMGTGMSAPGSDNLWHDIFLSFVISLILLSFRWLDHVHSFRIFKSACLFFYLRWLHPLVL